jgi:hypothetical protein
VHRRLVALLIERDAALHRFFELRALLLGRGGNNSRTQSSGYAIVVISAFSACRESSRVNCTTIGTSDSITLA